MNPGYTTDRLESIGSSVSRSFYGIRKGCLGLQWNWLPAMGFQSCRFAFFNGLRVVTAWNFMIVMSPAVKFLLWWWNTDLVGGKAP